MEQIQKTIATPGYTEENPIRQRIQELYRQKMEVYLYAIYMARGMTPPEGFSKEKAMEELGLYTDYEIQIAYVNALVLSMTVDSSQRHL